MSENAKMRKALANFIGSRSPQVSVVCIVKSINMATLTCYCEPINGDAGITDVRLMAIVSKGFLKVPKVNSQVVVMFIDDTTAVVSKTSTVDKIELNGSFYGGIPKAGTLSIKYNALELKVNQLIAAVIAINTAASGSPGTPVTNAILAGFLAPITPTPLTPTNSTELQNTTVTHGNGT